MKRKLLLSVMFVVPLLVASCSSASDDDAGATGTQSGASSQGEATPSSDASESPSSSDGDDTPSSDSAAPSESGDADQDESEPGDAAPDAAEPEDAGPDLSGIPDVVAEVDGHKIEKAEFVDAYQAQYQQMMIQAQQSGQEPDEDEIKKQVAEGLVGRQLLLNEVDHQRLTASDKQIDDELADLAEQNGLDSVDDLMEAYAGQGIDEAEVRDQVATQVGIEQLIADEAGDPTPSDKEVREYYDDAIEQQGAADDDDTPSFDEVKAQIEDQLEQQNESEAAQKLVNDLRKDADVTVNV